MDILKHQLVTFYYPKLKLYTHYLLQQARGLVERLWDDIQRQISYIALSEEQLIAKESQIGRRLFGDIPAGHEREFFNVNEHTWIWYESWHDSLGKRHERTIKYDIRHSGVWKRVDEGGPEPVLGCELNNFAMAMGLYFEQVMPEVYSRDPVTGRLFSD